MVDKWNEAGKSNGVSQLSGTRIPNANDRERWTLACYQSRHSECLGTTVPMRGPAVDCECSCHTKERMNDNIRDIAQNAMDNAAADKGAAEHDSREECPVMFSVGHAGSGVFDKNQQHPRSCQCGGTGWIPRLEDAVSGTTRPNETAKGRILRLMQVFYLHSPSNERTVQFHDNLNEYRDLAQHLAGNLWPDAYNQPTFQDDN